MENAKPQGEGGRYQRNAELQMGTRREAAFLTPSRKEAKIRKELN